MLEVFTTQLLGLGVRSTHPWRRMKWKLQSEQ